MQELVFPPPQMTAAQKHIDSLPENPANLCAGAADVSRARKARRGSESTRLICRREYTRKIRGATFTVPRARGVRSRGLYATPAGSSSTGAAGAVKINGTIAIYLVSHDNKR